jgi:hypothetical protein
MALTLKINGTLHEVDGDIPLLWVRRANGEPAKAAAKFHVPPARKRQIEGSDEGSLRIAGELWA